jgi:hypothetical protein
MKFYSNGSCKPDRKYLSIIFLGFTYTPVGNVSGKSLSSIVGICKGCSA